MLRFVSTCLAQLFQDLFVRRKAVGVELTVDKFVVEFYIENAAAALDEGDFGASFFFDSGRQTGGLWCVVSLHAVGNRNFHRKSPCCEWL